MTEILDRNIKDLIAEHPGVGELLENEGIACVSCQAGTCRTRDIIEVHGLSAQRERAVLARIAALVDPGRKVEIPMLPRASPALPGAPLSPPLRMLVDEHAQIKRWLALVAPIAAALRRGEAGAVEAARSGVEFLRGYADSFHHAKEEDTLFPCFDPGLEIVRSMRAEHETARGRVREVVAALEQGDGERAAAGLEAHRDLLSEHIRKEDEILFPWMDRTLGTSAVGRLYGSFVSIESGAAGRPAELCASIAALSLANGPPFAIMQAAEGARGWPL